jgi:hypothetical protein
MYERQAGCGYLKRLALHIFTNQAFLIFVHDGQLDLCMVLSMNCVLFFAILVKKIPKLQKPMKRNELQFNFTTKTFLD